MYRLPALLTLLTLTLLCLPAGHAAKPAEKLAPAPAQPGPPPLMRMHFIDVGQGSATLLEFPCGAVLVDAGGEDHSGFHSTERLIAYLDAFFARRMDLAHRLDALVLTHPHIDHVRGVPAVLNRYTVRNIVHNGQTPMVEEAISAMKTLEDYAARAAAGEERMVHVEVIAADTDRDYQTVRAGPVVDPLGMCQGVDPQLRMLWGQVRRDPGWGSDSYDKPEFGDENNHSVVTRVDFGGSSLLITGDLEIPAIGSLLQTHEAALLDVDVYLVGHHGSHNGTTAGLLAALTPDWAVLGVGNPDRKHSWTAWQYGHPRAATVELLEQGVLGAAPPREVMVGTGQRAFTPESIDRAILATGWDGTIVLEGDPLGKITRGTPEVVPEIAPVAPGAAP